MDSDNDFVAQKQNAGLPAEAEDFVSIYIPASNSIILRAFMDESRVSQVLYVRKVGEQRYSHFYSLPDEEKIGIWLCSGTAPLLLFTSVLLSGRGPTGVIKGLYLADTRSGVREVVLQPKSSFSNVSKATINKIFAFRSDNESFAALVALWFPKENGIGFSVRYFLADVELSSGNISVLEEWNISFL